MSESLFYDQVVPLNDTKHKHLRFSPLTDYGFSRTVNSVPIVLAELAEVAREYPIGFARTPDGSYLPVALLGLREKENLFVGKDGRWVARYIPAFVRRYPFVPTTGANGQLVVCMDTKASCLGKTGADPLFVAGQPSTALSHVMAYLREFHASGLATAEACRRLAEQGLFREVGTLAQIPGGGRYQLTGLQVIDEDRLKALGADVAHNLLTNGDLMLAYAHLLSMGNIQRLVDRLSKRLSG